MDQRVAQCHLIASVLAADGMMAGPERAFLDSAMQALGLTDAEREQVTSFEGAEGAAEELRRLPEAERRVIVDDLVDAALVDRQISPHETALVEKLAAALGL
jgi:uncharacterized tellurite resistance protein B-like protein